MKPVHLIWDYRQLLGDEDWRARRLAEFFPFIIDSLSDEDKALLLSRLDELHVPEERKELIKMVCHEKSDPV